MRKKLIATLRMMAAITTACGPGPAQASDPPGRPTGVSAEVQWEQVVIEWDSPADPGVTHHRVYRQTEEQEETLVRPHHRHGRGQPTGDRRAERARNRERPRQSVSKAPPGPPHGHNRTGQ